MKFYTLFLPLFFLACGPNPEPEIVAHEKSGFYNEGAYIVAAKHVVMPGDLLAIKFSLPQTIFFRFLDNSEEPTAWEPFDNTKIKSMRLKTVQFATQDSDVQNTSVLTWSLDTNLAKYYRANIVSRQQWCARAPHKGMVCDEDKCQFAVHHSAGPAALSEKGVQNIQTHHMDVKKWSDIGYHFFIGLDGTCFEGRELSCLGAHVSGHNKGNIGICFLGCFDSSRPNKVEPTDEMINKMAELIGVLAAHYGITPSRETIKGHNEYAPTLCPGDLVMSRMDEILLKALLTKREILDC